MGPPVPSAAIRHFSSQLRPSDRHVPKNRGTVAVGGRATSEQIATEFGGVNVGTSTRSLQRRDVYTPILHGPIGSHFVTPIVLVRCPSWIAQIAAIPSFFGRHPYEGRPRFSTNKDNLKRYLRVTAPMRSF